MSHITPEQAVAFWNAAVKAAPVPMDWASVVQTMCNAAIQHYIDSAALAQPEPVSPHYRKGCSECDMNKQVREADDQWKRDVAKGREIIAAAAKGGAL